MCICITASVNTRSPIVHVGFFYLFVCEMTPTNDSGFVLISDIKAKSTLPTHTHTPQTQRTHTQTQRTYTTVPPVLTPLTFGQPAVMTNHSKLSHKIHPWRHLSHLPRRISSTSLPPKCQRFTAAH